MKHILSFNTVEDRDKIVKVITRGFTSNVTSEGTALIFSTSYRIGKTAQTSILQDVPTRQCDFNLLEEGKGK